MVNETMSTAEKLAPCPFCGGEAKFRLRSEDLIEEDDYDVQCGTNGCYLEFGGDWFLTKNNAAVLWNRRAQPAADGAQRVERMSEEQERTAFEAAMRRDTFDTLERLSDGSYKSYEARVGWVMWIASAACSR